MASIAGLTRSSKREFEAVSMRDALAASIEHENMKLMLRRTLAHAEELTAIINGEHDERYRIREYETRYTSARRLGAASAVATIMAAEIRCVLGITSPSLTVANTDGGAA